MERQNTLAQLLGGDNYLTRSADGIKRGAGVLADMLAQGSQAGIDDMQAALSGYRVPEGAVMTDAGYVMPETLAQGSYNRAEVREPDTMRALTLFGGAMTPARGVGIAAKAGAEGKAAVAAGKALPMDEASRMARANDQGYEYFRRSRNASSPDNGIGYSMFVRGDDPAAEFERLSGYGPAEWMASGDGAVDVGDIQKDIVKALYRSGVNRVADPWGRSAADMARAAAPRDIVDHAGLWDNPELVQTVYDQVLEPRGITAVKTPDGLLSFDHPNVRSRDAAFDPRMVGSADYMASSANLGPLENALVAYRSRDSK